MSKLYEDLKEGFEDILAYRKGKLTLRSERILIPDPPMEYRAKDIKRIRRKCDYSQSIFAAVLNVSIRTVQSWETGARVPNHSALRLLEIIDKGIYPPQGQKQMRAYTNYHK